MLCWSQRSSFHVGPLRRVRRYRDGRQRLNGNRHPRHSTMRDPTSFSPAQRQLQECQGALLCLSLPFPSVYALYTTLATLPTPRHPPFRTPSPPTPSTKSAHRHQPVISQAIRHPLTIHPLRHSYLSWSVCCHRCIFFCCVLLHSLSFCSSFALSLYRSPMYMRHGHCACPRKFPIVWSLHCIPYSRLAPYASLRVYYHRSSLSFYSNILCASVVCYLASVLCGQ